MREAASFDLTSKTDNVKWDKAGKEGDMTGQC